jgi:hypothetical protein
MQGAELLFNQNYSIMKHDYHILAGDWMRW